MVTIFIYGLDQFVVGRLSREMTKGLAKLYEMKEEDINFVAPNNMVFHNGVEQTSWNIIIHVHAPMKVSVLQDLVKQFIFKSIGELAIHKTIEFYYYDDEVDPLTAQIAQILDANISRNFKITVKKGYIGEDYTEQKENNRHGLK